MEIADLYNRAGYRDLRSLALLSLVADRCEPEVIAEQGTYHGASAATLAAAAPDATVYTIDNGRFGVTAEQVESNLAALGITNVHVLTGESSTLGDRLLRLGVHSIDLAFIDADHRYESARADYDSIFPLLHDDSIVILDDVDLPEPDDVGALLSELSPKFEEVLKFDYHRGIAVLGPLHLLELLDD